MGWGTVDHDGEARLDAWRERRLGREYDGNRRGSRGRIRRYRGITERGERTVAEMNVFRDKNAEPRGLD